MAEIKQDFDTFAIPGPGSVSMAASHPGDEDQQPEEALRSVYILLYILKIIRILPDRSLVFRWQEECLGS